MTLTMPTVEQETDDLKALDFDVECSESTCTAHATWWFVCRACNRHTPWCGPHLVRRLLFFDGHARVCAGIHTVICTGCELEVWAPRWRTAFEVVPLEGT